MQSLTTSRKLVLGGLAVVALAATACSSSGGDNANGASTPAKSTAAVPGSTSGSPGGSSVKTITYVNPLPSYPAFNVAGECVKKEAQKRGVKAVEVGISGSKVDAQQSIDQISQAIVSGTDGLIVLPTSVPQFTPVLTRARSKGIYVVGMNGGSSKDGQQTTVGTDNQKMGAIIADGIGKVDPNAHVGLLAETAETVSQMDQIRGLKAEAKKKFPNMKFPSLQFDQGDTTKDVDIFSSMLAANPDITAIFPARGASVPAAMTAVKERGMQNKVRVVGLDLTDPNRAAIENGTLYAVGEQGWCNMGTKSVDAILDLAAGKSVPELIDTGATFITKENLPPK